MERLLVEFCIRAALIVLTTAGALRGLRIKVAAAQHAVWAGVLMVMLLLPLWLAWGPKAGVPVLPAVGEPALAMMQPAAPINFAADTPPIAVPAPVPQSAPTWNWNTAALGIYLLGAFVLLLRLAIGTIRANHLSGDSCVAPVTVGLFRPRIILPASSVNWPRAQLDAVMTHEREHARRRDPLFQWLALFNRAVFWFHPLAWWLERKLSALAEEACDAAVLEHGHDPREYSVYLLELARAVQRAGTRVNVVAMAMPGSYLPQRVKSIIDGIRAPKLSRGRLACAALACAIPVAVFASGTLDRAPQILRLPLPAAHVPQPAVLLAQATVPPGAPEAPKLEFEVAAVRPFVRNPNGSYPRPQTIGGPGTSDPTRITYSNYPLKWLLQAAYDLKAYQISGPDWLNSEQCVIEATIRAGATKEQVNLMLRNLLTDRFKMTVHRETKDLPLYELVLIKKGPKLKESLKEGANDGEPLPAAKGFEAFFGLLEEKDGFLRLPPNMPVPPLGGPSAQWSTPPISHNVGGNQTMAGLVVLLSNYSGRPVVDKTGLTGNWDYNLDFAMGAGPVNAPDNASDPAPDLVAAVRDQLGLKMESKKGPVEMLVIDHIEKTPTEN